jgi:hypothetical protein
VSVLRATVLLASSGAARLPPTGDPGQVVVWVAVPAAILGAIAAGAIKRFVLAHPRFLAHRPGVSTFVWVGLADAVAWAILWPALLAARLQASSSHRGLWVLALLVAELFTILMPVLSVVFALVLLFVRKLWAAG